ncbi:flagellar type III secretion system pore protein FliP [Xanthomonas cucurbitae]|uniref:Flagellar biosynthetic protein FliP n=1 Tax=Xanthomonas cucurbitae TaxID=56453 RepID=A0ABY7YCW4_9XANT|nr:flagellar type III secretion system pore protein FliP [Xanthomonas cucurbitae]WDM67834.1 flagellar type III secretion system pore protein FliP [Xanthomonas cucurbitae]WDM71708.1 flagellar type III secretion system pore protein FliP [Xanthomonas cucurbitae]
MTRFRLPRAVLIGILAAMFACAAASACADPLGDALNAAGKQEFSSALRVFVLMTMLSFIPVILIGMTCFTRIIVVLVLLRHALGIPQTPPNSVLITLAMLLTLFSMGPVLDRVQHEAVAPYLADQITATEAITRATPSLRDFMVRQTRESDLLAISEMARVSPPKTIGEIHFTHLAAAFLLSELRTAFQMGFVIFLPFLMIDLVVSAVLMALGIIMLPPATVSLPLKLLLFILIDGWVLVSRTLLGSIWS